jgi:hypothetical protein
MFLLYIPGIFHPFIEPLKIWFSCVLPNVIAISFDYVLYYCIDIYQIKEDDTVGHVAFMREARNVYKYLVRTPWEIKMDGWMDGWMCVCVCVQLSARRLVGSSYSASTRYVRAHTHAHTYTCIHTCPCTAHPIPPLQGVLSQELNGVGWPVPYPLRTAHNQAMMKCTWLKICNTNLIYLHHPQADKNNESACILV